MTLTEAAYWTRRFGVIAVGALAILILLVVVILNWPKNTTPPEYAKANFACTDLASDFVTNKLTIPSIAPASGSDNYFSIETKTGVVDRLPRVINVYKYANPGQSINSQGEAKTLAKSLGFNPDAMIRDGVTAYIWNNTITAQQLTVQAKDLNFKMSTDFTKSNSKTKGIGVPSEDIARSTATNYLKNKGLLTEDYAAEKPLVMDIKIEPDGSFIHATSKDETDLIRVDFVRKKPFITIRSDSPGAADIKKELTENQNFDYTQQVMNTSGGEYTVYNFNSVVVRNDTQKSYLSVYVGYKNDKSTLSATKDVVVVFNVDYTNWLIETVSCGTYELIPAQSALDLVKNGSGNLVYLNEKNGDDVVPYIPRVVKKYRVLDVTIGYYDAPEAQTYLLPVYIVHGEATFDTGTTGFFYYYVPAINYNVITNKVVETSTPIPTQSGGLF